MPVLASSFLTSSTACSSFGLTTNPSGVAGSLGCTCPDSLGTSRPPFSHLSNGRLDSCSSSMAGLGGTPPQNCGALLAPDPAGGARSRQSGSRRTLGQGVPKDRGRQPVSQGRLVSNPPAPCPGGLARVPVCACHVHVHLSSVHWALVRAFTCSCVHTPTRVPVCAGSWGRGPVNWKSLRRQTRLRLEEELHALPRNLMWGPRTSSDGGAEAGQGGGGVGALCCQHLGSPGAQE